MSGNSSEHLSGHSIYSNDKTPINGMRKKCFIWRFLDRVCGPTLEELEKNAQIINDGMKEVNRLKTIDGGKEIFDELEGVIAELEEILESKEIVKELKEISAGFDKFFVLGEPGNELENICIKMDDIIERIRGIAGLKEIADKLQEITFKLGAIHAEEFKNRLIGYRSLLKKDQYKCLLMEMKHRYEENGCIGGELCKYGCKKCWNYKVINFVNDELKSIGGLIIDN